MSSNNAVETQTPATQPSAEEIQMNYLRDYLGFPSDLMPYLPYLTDEQRKAFDSKVYECQSHNGTVTTQRKSGDRTRISYSSSKTNQLEAIVALVKPTKKVLDSRVQFIREHSEVLGVSEIGIEEAALLDHELFELANEVIETDLFGQIVNTVDASDNSSYQSKFQKEFNKRMMSQIPSDS